MSATDLVIFDCDGVLIDSELIGARVEAAALGRVGMPLAEGEILTRFLGMTAEAMYLALEAEHAACDREPERHPMVVGRGRAPKRLGPGERGRSSGHGAFPGHRPDRTRPAERRGKFTPHRPEGRLVPRTSRGSRGTRRPYRRRSPR